MKKAIIYAKVLEADGVITKICGLSFNREAAQAFCDSFNELSDLTGLVAKILPLSYEVAAVVAAA